MSSFLRGLVELESSRKRTAERKARISPRLLLEDDELGRTFRAGDTVRDSVTGGEGRVERVEVRRVIIPTARR